MGLNVGTIPNIFGLGPLAVSVLFEYSGTHFYHLHQNTSQRSPHISINPGKKNSSALLAQEFSICKIYVDSQTTRTLILGSASSDAGSFTVYTLLINIYILIMIHPKRGKPILNQLSLWRRGDIYHSIRLLKI